MLGLGSALRICHAKFFWAPCPSFAHSGWSLSGDGLSPAVDCEPWQGQGCLSHCVSGTERMFRECHNIRMEFGGQWVWVRLREDALMEPCLELPCPTAA